MEFLHGVLKANGIRSSLVYGSMDADARVMNVEAFRRHRADVLVVTDVAARGLDIRFQIISLSLSLSSGFLLCTHVGALTALYIFRCWTTS